MTQQTITKTPGKTLLELMLERKLGLPGVTTFDLGDPLERDEQFTNCSNYLQYRKKLVTSSIQPENFNQPVPVNDN